MFASTKFTMGIRALKRGFGVLATCGCVGLIGVWSLSGSFPWDAEDAHDPSIGRPAPSAAPSTQPIPMPEPLGLEEPTDRLTSKLMHAATETRDAGAPRTERTTSITVAQSKTWSSWKSLAWVPPELATAHAQDPIQQAKLLAKASATQLQEITSYTCQFTKRERIGETLVGPHFMTMKVRHDPMSIYFKFHKPSKGKEAIYVEGQNDNCVLAHEMGVLKVLAGSLKLKPTSKLAMDGCRHPITSAGMQKLIATICDRWEVEMTPEGSRVLIDPEITMLGRSCIRIQSIHPIARPDYVCHRVDLYLDHDRGLPIRYEAYDYPQGPDDQCPLLEEYSFDDIQINVGLTDLDFDPKNASYQFGRF